MCSVNECVEHKVSKCSHFAAGKSATAFFLLCMAVQDSQRGVFSLEDNLSVIHASISSAGVLYIYQNMASHVVSPHIHFIVVIWDTLPVPIPI